MSKGKGILEQIERAAHKYIYKSMSKEEIWDILCEVEESLRNTPPKKPEFIIWLWGDEENQKKILKDWDDAIRGCINKEYGNMKPKRRDSRLYSMTKKRGLGEVV